MSKYLVMVSMLALAACKGGGPETVGSGAVTGGPSGNGTTASQHTFVAPTVAKTYTAIGGVQHYYYSTDSRQTRGQQGQNYSGNSTGVRDSTMTISYDPRDGIFEMTVADPKSGTQIDTRFQDPAHRTDFGGAREPQWGISELPTSKNVRYVQVASGSGSIIQGNNTTPDAGLDGSSTDKITMFFEVPGTTTKYVSYAGFLRNQIINSLVIRQNADGTTTEIQKQNWDIQRGAFAYGELTAISAVPKTGTGTYNGSMLATMVNNPTFDDLNPDGTSAAQPSYFQWIEGTSQTTVDFGANDMEFTFNGNVLAPQVDRYTGPGNVFIPGGSTFTAEGSARIDLTGTGGFTGAINSASFSNNGQVIQTWNQPASVQEATNANGVIAGSGIDGAFFGPGGTPGQVEVGGSFRIVGGTPDQRVDILGAFTGAPQ